MKKPTAKLATAAGAAAASAVLAAVPATASPSTVWTVSGSPAAVSATGTGHVTLVLNGFIMTCSKSTASGTLRSATGNPAAVGSLTSVVFGAPGTPCTSVLGSPSMPASAPWSVVAHDYGASTSTTTGHLGGVDFRTTLGACVFRVRGDASVTYANATGKLAVASTDGELTVVESVNCGDLAPLGARPTLRGDYLVRAAGTGSVPTVVGSHP
ncbi:hypothetical protein ACFV2S_09775 [Streptomyces sp. NPDC059695]|uniref:hypothetical protein n=1 Tax=Streptomyces sp. NPDC059695 TaxID=3346910 RepID=UPI003687DBAF